MKYQPHNFDFVFANVNGKDKNEQILNACDWMSYWLKFKHMCGQKGCVIFDIDDTLVDDKEKQIANVIRIYKQCLKYGNVVNIITARPESKINRQRTEEMLNERGINEYEALYMMPSDIKPTLHSISNFKYLARKDVASRYPILANLGDMWSDHLKYPTKINELNDLDVKMCALFFCPGTNYPSLKLPGMSST